jgi:hypothetical protein
VYHEFVNHIGNANSRNTQPCHPERLPSPMSSRATPTHNVIPSDSHPQCHPERLPPTMSRATPTHNVIPSDSHPQCHPERLPPTMSSRATPTHNVIPSDRRSEGSPHDGSNNCGLCTLMTLVASMLRIIPTILHTTNKVTS